MVGFYIQASNQTERLNFKNLKWKEGESTFLKTTTKMMTMIMKDGG